MASFLSCQAIVHPDVGYSDTETAFLQPLVFTICFPGPVPRSLIERAIPIQVSVSLSEAYRGITLPEVRTGAWCLNEEPERLLSVMTNATIDDDIPIPFLPLPPIWDHLNSDHWLVLLKEIERWLVNDIRSPTIPQWTWGRDTFWLAFIGAYPSFPNERWEQWNPDIPLEGQFIEEWLTRDGIDGSTQATLSHIWDEFCRHAALFHPSPLIASS
ncbi:hypothetical protein L210DRAFT_3462180 [Boletus edulis BED1]|uniref:Uncharacterized protein n=1 Tax=Boletus edulis BED1 TaxID=1328754 RepID=A0AAD4BBQ7_BOLED|nr:hypothetical protein L210DRAFT_3462180 [Boletus edulis BED1]